VWIPPFFVLVKEFGMLLSFERTIACWVLAGAIFAGFFIPGLSELFKPFTSLSLFLLIVTSLLPMGRMEVNEVFTLDPRVWQIAIWQLLVLPAIIVAAAHLVRVDGTITILLVSTASAGSLFASPTFAELLQVNKKLALQCMVLSTFLMPLSYFVFFTLVLHANIDLDLVRYVNGCMIFLVAPLGLFLVYMGFAQAIRTRIADTIEGISRRSTILALVVFGIGIVGPARDLLHADTSRFFLYLFIISALGIGMAYLTAVVMFRQGINDALTASIVSGFRNVGLGFVLLSGVADIHTAQYVGISQIPIFLAPLLLSLLTRKQREAFQGAAEEQTSPLFFKNIAIQN
jgi:predicted Na+-dependent transporter